MHTLSSHLHVILISSQKPAAKATATKAAPKKAAAAKKAAPAPKAPAAKAAPATKTKANTAKPRKPAASAKKSTVVSHLALEVMYSILTYCKADAIVEKPTVLTKTKSGRVSKGSVAKKEPVKRAAAKKAAPKKPAASPKKSPAKAAA